MEDSFEKAARREAKEEARREVTKAYLIKKSRHSGSKKALRVFLFPYVLWGLLRAPNFAWSEQGIGQALPDFFFRTGRPFAIATGVILFFMWIWFIGDDDDDD